MGKSEYAGGVGGQPLQESRRDLLFLRHLDGDVPRTGVRFSDVRLAQSTRSLFRFPMKHLLLVAHRLRVLLGPVVGGRVRVGGRVIFFSSLAAGLAGFAGGARRRGFSFLRNAALAARTPTTRRHDFVRWVRDWTEQTDQTNLV